MLGPSTEPMVVAQMTVEIARPRRSGSARSAAANLAWRLAEEPAPNPAMPSSSSGKLSTTVASTTRPAPSAPIRYASTSPGRRPREVISAASGSESSAVPVTDAVGARPDSASDPLTRVASTGARAMPMGTPRPPSI